MESFHNNSLFITLEVLPQNKWYSLLILFPVKDPQQDYFKIIMDRFHQKIEGSEWLWTIWISSGSLGLLDLKYPITADWAVRGAL